MQDLLKVAYRKGKEASFSKLDSEDALFVKEAQGWRNALSAVSRFVSPLRGAARGVLSTRMPGVVPGKITPRISRLVTQRGAEAAAAGLPGAGGLVGRAGIGAGIGALTSEDAERGAIIGGLGGLGLGVGSRMGSGALRKAMTAAGGKAARMVRQGRLAPTQEAVQQFMSQQVFRGPWKHQAARGMLGGAALGTAGLAGGLAAGSALAGEPESAGFGRYGQMLGATPMPAGMQGMPAEVPYAMPRTPPRM